LTGPPNARHLLPSANVQRPNAAARASLPHPTMSINKTRPPHSIAGAAAGGGGL
jgi:hypothetical protein